ncbi:MAG TPA: hypothetical protein VK598_04140 [Nitrospiraceae bacterium]|nr:hypothetical protein [Nitrospiraceae bacterium]
MSNIRPEFCAYVLSPDWFSLIERVGAAFSALLDEIERCLPPCREYSLVVTKLQEASMFVARGIAGHDTLPSFTLCLSGSHPRSL